MPVPVITFDGPSGSGKGTIAKRLAVELGWHYLDSGALYRVLGIAALRAGVAVDDVSALVEAANAMRIDFTPQKDGGLQVFLAGEDVTDAIRSEACGGVASQISPHLPVRQALLQKQIDFRQAPGLVTDGRDMGTVVFPDADLKFFLTASLEERAKRRQSQLRALGIDAKIADLVLEQQARDDRDTKRQVSPLKPADNGIIVDTTGKSIDEVYTEVRAATH